MENKTYKERRKYLNSLVVDLLLNIFALLVLLIPITMPNAIRFLIGDGWTILYIILYTSVVSLLIAAVVIDIIAICIKQKEINEYVMLLERRYK